MDIQGVRVTYRDKASRRFQTNLFICHPDGWRTAKNNNSGAIANKLFVDGSVRAVDNKLVSVIVCT